MNEILTLEDLVQEAKECYSRKDYSQAADLYRMAAYAYKTQNDKVNAAEQMNNCSVAYLQAGEPQSAFDSAEGTDIVFSDINDPVREALSMGNQAAALEDLHRDAEALDLYRKSADLLKSTNEKELRSHVMKKISALQIRTGDKMDATVSMYGALQDKKNLTGKEKTLKKMLDTLYGYMGIKTK
jgi:tetratricopeptide (TPR) repeat protein